MSNNPCCVKLYCDLPSLLDGILERDYGLYLDLRNEIHQLVNSIGNDVEYLGGSGTTTTWNIQQNALLPLLRKIQHFNGPSTDYPCVIHIELY